MNKLAISSSRHQAAACQPDTLQETDLYYKESIPKLQERDDRIRGLKCVHNGLNGYFALDMEFYGSHGRGVHFSA